MRTLRVNIPLGREPGVATASIRLGNKWVWATLRGISPDDLPRIELDLYGSGSILMRLLREAAGRHECFAKAGLRRPWVEWSPPSEDPAP